MQAPEEIVELVERFSQGIEDYRRAEYKEANVRIQFIDPLFEALGWDVRNVSGYAEQYKDVVHEATLRGAGEARSPDYSFRIGGVRKFFLEAKKPSVDLKEGVGPAYQLRRYAWTAALPLSVLTDFEELAVYDCRVRPKPGDKASVARIMYVGYEQYVDRFDEIHRVFSKVSVLQGSFDRYVQEAGLKRGTTAVGVEFLQEIERWRDALARNIALRNPDLSVHELNFAVQRTIDRIIFLRMAEDRGIERYGRLRELIENVDIRAQLNRIYREADEKYNAGLFDFQTDTLTPDLSIDDKVLNSILGDLYYPQSPYEFSVLSADVLGQVYEQFLGKVIRLTAGHQAKVEQKPEVKKAGGVYYTPTYIVDYIVHQTVGKLIKGKTPRHIAKLRVLDPACGSGSFLLGAYQVLLDYHLRYYSTHDPVKIARGRRPAIYQGSSGDWQLTTAEKKRILLNNIYGVDIDRQAVEVTKLSLLLKVLEGETEETLGQQLGLWREPALPDMGDNIKCGNSLIGLDYFEGELMPDEEELRYVNPFDWESEFLEIMSAGGFDVVIGNPPYVRQEALRDLKVYLEQHYESFQGTADKYVYFMEKSFKLLRADGLFSIIVSSSFLHTNFATGLRRFLRNRSAIIGFVDFGGLAVFKDAKDTYVCIPLLAKKTQPKSVGISRITSLEILDLKQYVEENTYLVSHKRFGEDKWSLREQKQLDLFYKIRSAGIPLGDYVSGAIYSGIKTRLNEAFVVDLETKSRMASKDRNSAEILRPFFGGKDIRRYLVRDEPRYLIAIPDGWTRRQIESSSGRGSHLSEKEAWQWFAGNFIAISEHLEQYVQRAKRRQDQGEFWWELRSCDYYHVLDDRKIVYPDIAKYPRFFLDEDGSYISNTAYCIGGDDLYLLGILNSQLFWFSIGNISIPFGTRAGQYRYRLIYQYMEQVPIRGVDLDNQSDVIQREMMVSLVKGMLDLHKKLNAANVPADRELYERQIEAIDRRIDELVYELYELTEKEIAIVEAEDR